MSMSTFTPPPPAPPSNSAPVPHAVRVAKMLGCSVAAVVAIREVETGGLPGFLQDGTGRPRILFEAKYFHDRTNGRYDLTHPNISSAAWNSRLYRGGAAEYARLDAAIALDRDAAQQSTSWGLFQIMGANYAACGFPDVGDFVAAMYHGEGQQFDAFGKFIMSQPMLHYALKMQQWETVARLYNGPSYSQNRYDEKLKAAFQKAAGQPLLKGALTNTVSIGAQGEAVRAIQRALTARNFPVTVDGLFGQVTEIAVKAFQRRANLDVDGVVGQATWNKLRI